ncbi:MAG: alpha/beta hydrolase [Leptolyngbya sp. SIO4C1]|nr:alpha/beta hydrolase [Leptolyngbya sp. SIO4C1]
MTQVPTALWLTVSPHLKKFDQRLLCQLTRAAAIRRWEYIQTPDEPCCLETPVELLHDYIRRCDCAEAPPHQVHLLGHGLSGIIGLLYARRFPHRVKSLTLLSVGAHPANNWHRQYYALRQLLPCSRDMVLAQMVRSLFGMQGHRLTQALMQVLGQDLDTSLALHSLTDWTEIAGGGIESPLLVCWGAQDSILGGSPQTQWQPWLKPNDRAWSCPGGRHFFHFDHAQQVASTIRDYWQSLPTVRSQPLNLIQQ